MTDPAIRIGNEDLGGIVTGPNGREAGVWVIAETTDLSTKFAKIVVTDDQGRYVMPGLPKATYSVWVRGYGLVDSPKVKSGRGQIAGFIGLGAAMVAGVNAFGWMFAGLAITSAVALSALATSALKDAAVSIETDQELLAKFSGNVNTMTTYITTLMAQISVIYERDVSVRLTVNLVQAWTTTDPYTATGTLSQAPLSGTASRELLEDVADAVKAADVIMIAVPDTLQKSVYDAEIEPHLRPGQLVDGEALAPWRDEGAERPMGYLDAVPALPAPPLERLERGVVVSDPVDKDRPIALEMVGEQDARRPLRQLDHRHPGPHPVDREDEAAAQRLGEVAHVRRDVATGA